MEEISFFVENKSLFVVLHVLSVVVGMGSAIISDLLFNFYSKNKSLNGTERNTLKFLSNIVWIALVFIILSGLALFFSDPATYIHSHKFISKMLIIVVLLINGVFLHKFVAPHFNDRGLLKFKSERSIRQIAFACGAISIVSWIVVCTLGILQSIPFHFSQFVLYYGVFTACAILVALFVEKRTFK